jgi:hypothetical protein
LIFGQWCHVFFAAGYDTTKIKIMGKVNYPQFFRFRSGSWWRRSSLWRFRVPIPRGEVARGNANRDLHAQNLQKD